MRETIREARLQGLMQKYTKIWWDIDKRFPKLNPKINYWNKKKNEMNTDKFIEDFLEKIRNFPEDEKSKVEWKIEVQKLINKFIKDVNIITEEDKKILFSEDLINSTKHFVKEAKVFNEKLEIEEIGQALRNIWITNIIQLLLSIKIETTPAVFGYSMLYPYTDNYLDDVNNTINDKKLFSNKLKIKLTGEEIKASNNYEQDVFSLVSKIESQYVREQYPSVYDSLLMIHKAQEESFYKQEKISAPYEMDILGISFEKGGTSVLADAYMANGTLTNEYVEFFFGYGILLQLCDDLQDAKDDLKNNHMTIVSQIATKYSLDNITNALVNFTCDLLNKAGCFNIDNINGVKELIRKNCLLLIYFAIAKNKSFYSDCYYQRIKDYFPYTPRYMNKLNKKVKAKFSKLDDSYNGTKVEDIFLYALNDGDLTI
ncbi:hypothetical protein [Clostridium sp. DL1XJH146]